MIRFKVGEEIKEFDGKIDVSTSEKYLSEKKSPFNPALTYRFGRYYQDTLDIMIIISPTQYEELYYKIASCDTFIIAWQTPTGYQYRHLSRQILPYPDEMMYITEEINLKLESNPYNEIKHNMPNITLNTSYNLSSIANTIF